MNRSATAFLFAAPALLFLTAVLIVPLLVAVYLSLQDIGIIGQPGRFVGLENYSASLTSPKFWDAFFRSLIWVAANALVQTGLALLVALALFETFPGVRVARTWIILTWIVPTVVVVIIWRWLFSNSGGLINPLLMSLGVLDKPVGFFSTRESAMATLVFINSWRWFPFVALMLLAALTRIPGELFEASRLDGASAWKRFRFITWPLLQPTLLVLGVVGTLMSFNVFDVIWLMTAGGPSGGTTTLPVLIYETAFKGYRLSEAAAISVLTSMLLMGFAIFASRSMMREAEADEANRAQNLLLAITLLFVALLVGLPFWWVITGSIKLPAEILSREPTMVPHSFTMQHYQKLLGASAYGSYLLNSLIVSVSSTLLTLLLAIPAAYAFFRLKFAFKDSLFRFVLVGYAFPSISILIPLFGLFAKIGLVDSPLALIIVNVALALPFSIWMLRSFMASVPREIEEAAIMDGAKPLALLILILVPVIAPGIASVAMFAFVSSWTEYLFASVLIISDAKRTIPVGFAGIIGQYQIDWGLLLAGATLAMLPVLVLFAIIGRNFVAGLTDGAVK